MTQSIGFVGLGAMGRPMARHLVDSGFTVHGFDPFAPTNPDDGIQRYLTARAVAEAVDVVCLMVATPQQAQDAIEGPDAVSAGLREGSVVIVMATVGPDAVEGLESLVTRAGGTVVDAPVSGGVGKASTGELLIMVSGAEDTVSLARPTLEALGGVVRYLGPTVGDAQRMKLVNQLLCGVHIAAAAEALAFARSLDIDPAVALDVVSAGAAASFMLNDRGPRMVGEDFAEPRSAVDIFVKDLGLVESTAAFPIPIAQAAAAQFRAASAAGRGRNDDSAVITVYTEQAEELI